MEVDEKPPSNKTNLGISSRVVSPIGSLARRFKGIGELWGSDWDIPPVRSPLCDRRILISEDI